MSSLPFVFASAFVIGLSGAMMPGPVLVATINRSARMGFMAGPLIVLGHAIIEAVLIAAILLGLGGMLERAEVLNPIMIAGGGMLIYLGLAILNDVRLQRVSLPGGPEAGSEARSESALSPVLDGIVTSASNPYWSLWWATIGLTYIGLATQLGPLGLPAFYSGHILSDLAWFSVVAAGVAAGTRHMTDVLYRSVLAACSTFLIFLGTVFAYQGATSLAAAL